MLADQLHVRRHGSCRRLGAAAAGVTRRAFGAALALLLGWVAVPVSAEGTKVKVGVLKLSSSAPIFLGVERGTFHKAGMVMGPLQTRDLVDGSFLEEALRALPR
jgi:hypothetical protein